MMSNLGGSGVSYNNTPNFKIVLLGEGRVGKTSILLRYVENTYADGRESTLQASYLEKQITLSPSDDTNIANAAKLYIWDTAGQERFHALGPIYYRDADGAVLVYDITDLQSFDRVKMWTKELRRMVGEEDKISLIIVGNKIDLAKTKRSVNIEDARNYAESVGAMYLETSAKSGFGVEEVFFSVTKRELIYMTICVILLFGTLGSQSEKRGRRGHTRNKKYSPPQFHAQPTCLLYFIRCCIPKISNWSRASSLQLRNVSSSYIHLKMCKAKFV